jgi:hypothetical protein
MGIYSVDQNERAMKASCGSDTVVINYLNLKPSPEIDVLEARLAARPKRLCRARQLARAIVNKIDGDLPLPIVECLLKKLRATRCNFPEDPELACSHAMALANAAMNPRTNELEMWNGTLIQELRNLTPAEDLLRQEASRFEIHVRGTQYCGLLEQGRFEEAQGVS